MWQAHLHWLSRRVLGTALLVAASLVGAAQVDVEGRVVSDVDSAALAGITVVVDGSSHGTATDANGYFRLRVDEPFPFALVFRGLGMAPHRVEIASMPGCDLHVCLHQENQNIGSVVVTAGVSARKVRLNTAVLRMVDKSLLTSRMAPSLSQTLEYVPGLHSMSIGNGMSKPMIRNMGFNRIAVIDRGIKQEGQQWGADHGLEFDQHAIAKLGIYKGPMSLQYGGDAMGGAIVINDDIPLPLEGVRGNASVWARSNAWLVGTSGGASYRGEHAFVSAQLTAQQYGDYSVPTDSIVYHTRVIPLYRRKLKNTAGHELDVMLSGGCMGHLGTVALTASHVMQRMGFFPGSHGIPSHERVLPDGDDRNIDLPMAQVAHTKVLLNYRSSASSTGWVWLADAGIQRNRREELAQFHTHYPNQGPPAKNRDLELGFTLWTLSASSCAQWDYATDSQLTMGVEAQGQRHGIDGYGFLLPRYRRGTLGAFAVARHRVTEWLMLEGGVRADLARISVDPFADTLLYSYLRNYAGYDASVARDYSQRSARIDRRWADYSWSVGANWSPAKSLLMKVHLGRSFRLPSVNELSANGVHHGSFRHERGDASLGSEKGYQLDVELRYETLPLTVSVSPFWAYYSNYLYINPSGDWSVLPHAGQLYRFQQAQATMWGGEVELHAHLHDWFTLGASGSYVVQDNLTDGYPLPFTPQPTLMGRVGYLPLGHHGTHGTLTFLAEPVYAFPQHLIARNEDVTEGSFRLNLQVEYSTRWAGMGWTAQLGCDNVLDTKYFNHLSYYRKLRIPEPGRSFRLSLALAI